MELEKLLELPLRNKCGQLARYILKTNWSPTLIGAKTGPLFSLGLLWPSVTLMFSTIFVPPLFPSIFTHVRYQPNFFSVSSNPYITVQSAGRTKTQLMREKRNKRPLGKWLHCWQLASVYLYLVWIFILQGTLRQLARVHCKFLGFELYLYLYEMQKCRNACLRFFQETTAINVNFWFHRLLYPIRLLIHKFKLMVKIETKWASFRIRMV